MTVVPDLTVLPSHHRLHARQHRARFLRRFYHLVQFFQAKEDLNIAVSFQRQREARCPTLDANDSYGVVSAAEVRKTDRCNLHRN